MKITLQTRKLHKSAVLARQKAYAPYSKFQVGAAVKAARATIFAGCNIENASYGATVCAERVAIWKAVSEGVTRFEAIVIVTAAKTPAAPCGLCLQVMAEFFDSETRIYLASPTRIESEHRFGDLLPLPFGPKQLREAK